MTCLQFDSPRLPPILIFSRTRYLNLTLTRALVTSRRSSSTAVRMNVSRGFLHTGCRVPVIVRVRPRSASSPSPFTCPGTKKSPTKSSAKVVYCTVGDIHAHNRNGNATDIISGIRKYGGSHHVEATASRIFTTGM